MPMNTVHLINPAAGKGRYADISTLDGEVYVTSSAGDGARYLTELLSGGGEYTVYAHGGDGTLNEAVNGIMSAGAGTRTLLIPVPSGSGNDFYKSAAAISEPVLADVIEYNGRYAINELNIGFDCGVVIRTDKIKKCPVVSGRAAYILGILGESLCKRATALKLTMQTDGGIVTRSGEFLLAAIANGSYYGGGFMAAPAADITDGKLDVVIVDDISVLSFAGLIGDYKSGAHIDRETLKTSPALEHCLSYYQCSSITVEGAVVFCADGEIFSEPSGRLEVKNIPSALYVAGSSVSSPQLVHARSGAII